MRPRDDAYDLVPAKSIEEERLRSFAAAVWPDRSPHDGLLSRWWRKADPACAVAAVHRKTNVLAALCAGRPSEWVVAGVRHPAVAICDWYVAPEHRGRLIGRRLVRQFEAPDRLMYAFSLSPDAVGYLTRLRWVGPHTSTLMVLPQPWIAKGLHTIFARKYDFDLRTYIVEASVLPPELATGLNHIEEAMTGAAGAHMLRGESEWTWRLSVCGERRYAFCVVHGEKGPTGYVAVRRSAPGRSRILDRLAAALVVDLVAVDDDPHILRALARRAVAMAREQRAGVVLAATTNLACRKAMTALGFAASDMLLLKIYLQHRAAQYMWVPKGPGMNLQAGKIALSFADSDVDLNL